MIERNSRLSGCLALLAIGACQPGPERRVEPTFSGIGQDEIVTVTGTEPFWSGKIEGDALEWSTPELPSGATAKVTRFDGNGGSGWSGTLEGQAIDILVAPGPCSDGMSDREYPYSAMVSLGEQRMFGCAYTDVTGFTGDIAP